MNQPPNDLFQNLQTNVRALRDAINQVTDLPLDNLRLGALRNDLSNVIRPHMFGSIGKLRRIAYEYYYIANNIGRIKKKINFPPNNDDWFVNFFRHRNNRMSGDLISVKLNKIILEKPFRKKNISHLKFCDCGCGAAVLDTGFQFPPIQGLNFNFESRAEQTEKEQSEEEQSEEEQSEEEQPEEEQSEEQPEEEQSETNDFQIRSGQEINQSQCILLKSSIDDVFYPSERKETVRQHIGPKNIVLCIDCSGSMSGVRLNSVKNSFMKSIEKIKSDNPESKIILITFNSNGIFHVFDANNSIQTNSFDELIANNDLQNKIKAYANNQKPIIDSYRQLTEKLNSLVAENSTRILSPLMYSTILASESPNSMVILGTDGIAEDRDEGKYRQIIDYCNRNNQVRINVYSFKDSECDLHSLGMLATQTGGRLNFNSDEFEFGSCVEKIIKEQSDQVKVTILAHPNCVTFKETNRDTVSQNFPRTKQELLYEFEINQNIPKEVREIIFQIQIESAEGTRIINEKLDLNRPYENQRIFHAFFLRQLSKLILNRNQIVNSMRNSFENNLNQNSFVVRQFNDINRIINSNSDNNQRELWALLDINSNEVEYQNGDSQNQAFMHGNLPDVNAIFTRINTIYQGFNYIYSLGDFDRELQRVFRGFEKEESNRRNKIIKQLKLRALECIKEAIKIQEIFERNFHIQDGESRFPPLDEDYRRAANELLQELNGYFDPFENRVQNAQCCATQADQLCQHRPSVSIFSDPIQNRQNQSNHPIRPIDLGNLNVHVQQQETASSRNGLITSDYEFIIYDKLINVRNQIEEEIRQLEPESEPNNNQITDIINRSNLYRINLEILQDYYCKHYLTIYRLDETAYNMLQ
jgi:hypothetical protein